MLLFQEANLVQDFWLFSSQIECVSIFQSERKVAISLQAPIFFSLLSNIQTASNNFHMVIFSYLEAATKRAPSYQIRKYGFPLQFLVLSSLISFYVFIIGFCLWPIKRHHILLCWLFYILLIDCAPLPGGVLCSNSYPSLMGGKEPQY